MTCATVPFSWGIVTYVFLNAFYTPNFALVFVDGLGECCELQCFLLDVVLFTVAREADVCRVSLAKQYLVEPVNLIQKLSLPLR